MSARLAIFDLDGTLLNTLDDLAEAANRALRAHGFPAHPVDAYKLFVGSGAAKLMERALPDGVPDAERERVLASFGAYYEAHREDRTAPYPGVTELLGALRGASVRLAVLSNKPHRHTVPMVEYYFPDVFGLVLGAREGVPVKPDPAAVHEILAHFGVGRGEAAYIGDSDIDMRTGRAAGLRTIGVTWGFRTKEELEQAGAQEIVHKASELETLLVDI